MITKTIVRLLVLKDSFAALRLSVLVSCRCLMRLEGERGKEGVSGKKKGYRTRTMNRIKEEIDNLW